MASADPAAESASEMSDSSPWVVYIIETNHGSLYTGITTDLERRFGEHSGSKKGARFFRTQSAQAIRYVEKMPSRSAALKREAAIKKLRATDKRKLIQSSLIP